MTCSLWFEQPFVQKKPHISANKCKKPQIQKLSQTQLTMKKEWNPLRIFSANEQVFANEWKSTARAQREKMHTHTNVSLEGLGLIEIAISNSNKPPVLYLLCGWQITATVLLLCICFCNALLRVEKILAGGTGRACWSCEMVRHRLTLDAVRFSN